MNQPEQLSYRFTIAVIGTEDQCREAQEVARGVVDTLRALELEVNFDSALGVKYLELVPADVESIAEKLKRVRRTKKELEAARKGKV